MAQVSSKRTLRGMRNGGSIAYFHDISGIFMDILLVTFLHAF